MRDYPRPTPAAAEMILVTVLWAAMGWGAELVVAFEKLKHERRKWREGIDIAK